MYLRVSARGRRSGCATRICLVTGQWGQRRRRGHSQVVSYGLRMTLKGWIGEKEEEWISEDHLPASLVNLLPFLALPAVFPGSACGSGHQDKGMGVKDPVRRYLYDFLEMWAERKERPQKGVLYRTVGETGGLVLEERRKNKGMKNSCLSPWQAWMESSQRISLYWTSGTS